MRLIVFTILCVSFLHKIIVANNHHDVSIFINRIGKVGDSVCFCADISYPCVCNINGMSHMVEAPLAALVMQEIVVKDHNVRGMKIKREWPPKDEVYPKDSTDAHPLLGKLTGREEPLNHLKRFPMDVKNIGTKFRFYDTNLAKKGIDLHYNTESSITSLGKYEKVYIIIHGWMGSSADQVELRNKLLNYKGVTESAIVSIDWRKGADFDTSHCLRNFNPAINGSLDHFYVGILKFVSTGPCLYDQSAANTVIVGREVGLLVYLMVKAKVVDITDVHVIGAGLGAHVAHFACKWVETLFNNNGDPKRVGRLTALDPVSRHFERYFGAHVNIFDANFVDVIHCSSVVGEGGVSDLLHGYVGMSSAVGLIDFYPNGGRIQPKCSINGEFVGSLCNHLKATQYFIDSLDVKDRKGLTSIPCSGWIDFDNCQKYSERTDFRLLSSMGIGAEDHCGSGVHYLQIGGNIKNKSSFAKLKINLTKEPNNKLNFKSITETKSCSMRGPKNVDTRDSRISPEDIQFITKLPPPVPSAFLMPAPEISSLLISDWADHPLCGQYRAPPSQGRVFAGTHAYAGQFPWQVGLMNLVQENTHELVYRPLCGGAILNEHWILTAAHCLDGRRNNMIKLVFGATDLHHPFMEREIELVKKKGEFSTDPINVFVHPNWSPCAEYKSTGYDIALIRLEDPLYGLPEGEYKDELINRICLNIPEEFTDTVYGKCSRFWGAGFGQIEAPTGDPLLSPWNYKLYWAPQEIEYGTYCTYTKSEAQNQVYRKFKHENEFCGVWSQEPYSAICFGDSGSPGIIYVGHYDTDPDKVKKIAYVMGVVSGGAHTCGRHRSPRLGADSLAPFDRSSFWTKTVPFVKWINLITKRTRF